MITTKFYLDTRSEKKDRTFPVKINITNNRRTFFINTGFSCIKEHWEGSQFSSNEINYRAKNVRLRDIMNKVEKVIFQVEEEGNNIENSKLKGIIEKKLNGKQDYEPFIVYLDEFVATKNRKGTVKVYSHTRSKIIEFDETATFKTITKEWLVRFENWLSESGCKINTIGIHFRNIRAVFNYCIDNEYTTLYPFRRFQIKKKKRQKEHSLLETYVS